MHHGQSIPSDTIRTRMRQKVTVVGAGNVGASLAQRLVEKEIADVVLIGH